MLLEAKLVYVPAARERAADLSEWGHLGLKTRATFGEAAIEAGTPDRGGNGDDRDGEITDAADAIANILHHLAYVGDAGDTETAIDRARLNFEAEL